MSLLDSNKSLLVSNNILNNNMYYGMEAENLLYILSILEILLGQINKDILEKFNYDKPFKLTTLKELSEILLKFRFFNNSGLRGICFERFVYDSLITKQPDITQNFLKFLYKLDGIEISDEIDVLLWGDEKGKWVREPNLNLTLLNIFKDDLIKISNKEYIFKNVLQDISYSNSIYGNVGKADLFVKQRNGKYWHGVNIKLNIEDLKMLSLKYKNLDIGVALTTKKLNYMDLSSKNLDNFFKKYPYIYIFKNDKNFGEILNIYINHLYILFEEINCEPNTKNTNSNISKLPPVFQIMYFHKDKNIYYFISELDKCLKQLGIFVPQRIFNENISGSFLFNNKLFYIETKNSNFSILKEEASII